MKVQVLFQAIPLLMGFHQYITTILLHKLEKIDNMLCKIFKKIKAIHFLLFTIIGVCNGYGQNIATTSDPVKTVKNFMLWYRNNKDRIYVPLVKGSDRDSTPYRVDYDSLNLYLKKLNKSNFFSTNFLNSIYNYVAKCDSNFMKHPQIGFIAKGFEFDIVTKLMDDVDLFDNIKSLKQSIQKRNKTIIIIKLSYDEKEYIIFNVKKYKTFWKIDSINGDFPK
jgi:hypothetical protein